MIVQGVKDYAILMLDPEGQVMSWNEGAQRIKGYTAEEIIGRHYSLFYHPKIFRPASLCVSWRMRAGKVVQGRGMAGAQGRLAVFR